MKTTEQTIPLGEVLEEMDLPLRISAGAEVFHLRNTDGRYICRTVGDSEIQKIGITYIRHAANNLPGLVEILREIEADPDWPWTPGAHEKIKQALASAERVEVSQTT